MCKHAVKNFPLIIKYVPDQYKIQPKCDKAVVENRGMLMFIPGCYKNQNMFSDAVDIYSHALRSVHQKNVSCCCQ